MEPRGLLTISYITVSPQGEFLFSPGISYVRLCFFAVYVTGVPDCSEEDLSVATALKLRWTTVLNTHEDGTQTLINSEEVSTNDDVYMKK